MSQHKEDGFLTPKDYDNDACSVGSTADQESDIEDNNQVHGSRYTLEPSEHDKFVLIEEDERETLLANNKSRDTIKRASGVRNDNGSPIKGATREGRRRRKWRRRRTRRRSHGNEGEEGELIFEMEAGFKDTSSQSDTSTTGPDRRKWGLDEKITRKSTRRGLALVHILIAIVFLLLTFGAYMASQASIANRPTSSSKPSSSWSNGTHVFAPTTILISLDGFRADFLRRNLTPALNSFIASGISPQYMLPSFPSVTFPNHFTLVTGLYPESHGVVGNTFWDPELREEFNYTDQARSMQSKWWTAEPLWVTAESQGVRSAIHMWPGSEAHIPPIEPTYLDRFNETEALIGKVDRLLSLLDLPGDDDDMPGLVTDRRPQLIAAYVPNVDADGHMYGPNSTEIRSTISDVDSMLALLMEGLYARNLTEIINVVIVSDHGMATTSTNRLIQLENIADMNLVDHIDGWPLRGLRVKDPEKNGPIVFDRLMEAATRGKHFDVYTKETMPERYHFRNNDRIAPLWIIPKTGWAVVEKDDFDVVEAVASGKTYHPLGLHGYDHEHPLMRAIFVARGPAFPHKPNSRVPVFQNIEVYNIVCDSLGIQPRPNNGTLRLPLKPEGLHGDEDALPLGTPSDPVSDGSHTHSETRPGHMQKPDRPTPIESEQSAPPTEPSGVPADSPKSGTRSSWWEYMHEQLEKAKEWAKEVINALKHKGSEADDS